jgi:hypothetical protein
MARKDSMEAAQLLVESKRYVLSYSMELWYSFVVSTTSRDTDTIDLHGTTAAEAVYVAKNILWQQGKDKDGGMFTATYGSSRL